jgi:hypothetical protein
MTNYNPLEAVFSAALTGVVGTEEDFSEPDDDWLPIMLLIDDHRGLSVAAIDGQFMADDEAKEMLAQSVIPRLVKEVDAVAVAFVSSTWMSRGPRLPGASVPAVVEPETGEVRPRRPSEDPNRIEAVVVVACSLKGEITAVAEIQRTDDAPPTLGEWETNRSSKRSPGRFTNAIYEALDEGASRA